MTHSKLCAYLGDPLEWNLDRILFNFIVLWSSVLLCRLVGICVLCGGCLCVCLKASSQGMGWELIP